MADRLTVYRPARARVVVYLCAAGVLATMLFLAVALPDEGRSGWGIYSRLGVVAVGLVIVAFLHRLGSVRVATSESGVLVVNVMNRRRLEWAEIVGVRLLSGDAWMVLDLSDGKSLSAMGIQHSEGERGQQQAQAFARAVQQHTRTPGHG